MINKAIAQRFSTAFHAKDEATIENLVAEDYTFKGPMMQLNSRAALIDFMRNMPFNCSEKTSRYLEDGNTVVKICEVSFTVPFNGNVPMCEVFTLKDGKITNDELYYDTALFPKMCDPA